MFAKKSVKIINTVQIAIIYQFCFFMFQKAMKEQHIEFKEIETNYLETEKEKKHS